jgi:hypothetical protein
MSIDIFSLKAIENIAQSLIKWEKNLKNGLQQNEEPEEISVKKDWDLKFAGYVTQHYTAKTDSEGKQRAVKAYEKIMKQIPAVIKKEFVSKLQQNNQNAINYNLGTIPTLHSLIPLSQVSRRPIFKLRAKDGVVGSHFTKVNEYKDIIYRITKNVLYNLDTLESESIKKLPSFSINIDDI